MANQLIPADLRAGRILDVGCGSYPVFLTLTRFAEKWGVDRVLSASTTAGLRLQGIELLAFDADQDDRLPFEDEKFSAVTMLAVYEHLAEDRLKLLLGDVQRVLKPRGIFVMTTPAHWTDPLLSLMASTGLISSEELNEHKRSHRHQDIRPLLEQAGFQPDQIRMGFFEARMNLWAVAAK